MYKINNDTSSLCLCICMFIIHEEVQLVQLQCNSHIDLANYFTVIIISHRSKHLIRRSAAKYLACSYCLPFSYFTLSQLLYPAFVMEYCSICLFSLPEIACKRAKNAAEPNIPKYNTIVQQYYFTVSYYKWIISRTKHSTKKATTKRC